MGRNLRKLELRFVLMLLSALFPRTHRLIIISEEKRQKFRDNFPWCSRKTDDGNCCWGLHKQEVVKFHLLPITFRVLRNGNGKNFDVEMVKNLVLCVEIYFSLLHFFERPPRAKEKQIEKRDCFEIHGASQVPTVPFGFPFIPHRSLHASALVLCSPVIC